MEDNSSSTQRVGRRRSSLEAEVVSDVELKCALREEKSVIVIKDKRLSNETVLWLAFGHCLRHATLGTALGAIVCSSGMNDTLLQVAKPLAVSSLVMNIGYHSFWHHRPLNHYR
ncbi:hypothetical protein AVEN_176978-2 [Araneus ventricosus]|uniref:Uncharacterized protein n=1 Tax=Araneus ventricosus TaxID=182803 RepID=A0A4Y2VCI6_ARAVE|nr:hypothetical protein AVEN_176978-2 [Araneus ventricosus]